MVKMAQISTSKPTTQKAATGKPVIQKKDRLWGALWAGGKTVAVSFAKTGYALWLEVTGVLCALVTFRYASALAHEYQVHRMTDPRRFWTFAIFTGLFLWFTLLSFIKAKRMRK